MQPQHPMGHGPAAFQYWDKPSASAAAAAAFPRNQMKRNTVAQEIVQPQQPLLAVAAALSGPLPDAGACCGFAGLPIAPLSPPPCWMRSKRSSASAMLGRTCMSWAQHSQMSSRMPALRNLGSGRR